MLKLIGKVQQPFKEFRLITFRHHITGSRSYKFDFMNGFKYMWNDLLTSSWFKGEALAASRRRSYTLPS